jgi:diaminohydroxyphosphoribosylaminopyrimidine deaminase/5-amino-6-(5-phosphoribosylamino)uracil reductase
MAQALQLAKRGWYGTSPNPRVGCVLVREGEIIGEGWHRNAGEGHAEVNALAACKGGSAKGATAYVTLEPCAHQGKTPPCAEALIKAGVARVVIAMVDPNPNVAGKGIALLEAAGITVEAGMLADEAEKLNLGFYKRMRTGLPRVTVKLAMSLDGRTAMASGESQWITGKDARADVQRLRAESCAVVSGVDTVLMDDAALTVRPDECLSPEHENIWRQPLRVVLDSQLRLPADARFMLADGGVLVATLVANAGSEKYGKAELLPLPEKAGKIDLSALLSALAEQQCNEVLVEAGATLTGAFVAAGLVDRLVIYMAATLMGSAARPLMNLPFDTMAEQQRLKIESVRAVGDDWRIEASFQQ